MEYRGAEGVEKLQAYGGTSAICRKLNTSETDGEGRVVIFFADFLIILFLTDFLIICYFISFYLKIFCFYLTYSLFLFFQV